MVARFLQILKRYWWAGCLFVLLKMIMSYALGYHNGYYAGMHKADELRAGINKSLLECQQELERLRSEKPRPAPVTTR